jgi:threonine/homoserine/homoserine lactone efflux protein
MPIELPLLLGFMATALVIVVSPGPDTTLILRYTLVGGYRTGLATVAGVQLGLVVHTVAAVFGLSLLIASTPWAFGTIAVIGAGYLAWLGLQALRAGVLPDEDFAAAARIGPMKAGRDALLSNIFNPKVIMLFLALMPQFVRPEAGSVPLQLAFMAMVLIVMNIAWQTGLTFAAGSVRGFLMQPAVQRTVAWGTGAILFGFALLMLYEHLG